MLLLYRLLRHLGLQKSNVVIGVCAGGVGSTCARLYTLKVFPLSEFGLLLSSVVKLVLFSYSLRLLRDY